MSMAKPKLYFSRTSFLQNASLAWPMTCNSLLMQSVTIIDLLLIAPLGEVSIAAFGIAGAIISFVIGIQAAIANGSQLVLSRAAGAGDQRKVGLAVAAGWICNLSFSSTALLALLTGGSAVVARIAGNDAVADEALAYILVSLILLLFASASSVMVSYFNANKKTRIPMYGFMIEIPTNVLASFVFINGLLGMPKLGLAGAALGSVIAIVIRFVYLAYRLYREKRQGFVSGFSVVNRLAVVEHVKEVVPIVSNFIVLLVGLLLFQVIFAQLPLPSYAAITLVLPWIKIGSMFANTWAQASTIMVSQSLGKKDYLSIPPFVYQSLFVTRVISLFIALGFFFLSVSMPMIYPNLSPQTLSALAIIAPIYILLPLFRTNNMFCGNMIRAMGDSYMIVRINLLTQWVICIPLCALLVYLQAPLFLVFGVILFDEMIKLYSFRMTLERRLNSYADEPTLVPDN
ncbi:MATE family efflux transporter [Reinekea thalattae]|uniref:MATE family efflux transporter n=2 Tax=Reinekea thalattae TaxID=2593301 RepID=A0A5C8Z4W3_9GAMM|nr:MATE family efflux transporter [Reinekea thalattae]